MAWQNSLRDYSTPAEDCRLPISAAQHVGQGAVERIENFFAVPLDQLRTRFLSVWPGSEVSMTLESPTGVVIDPSTVDPNVVHDKGADYEYYEIDNPEPGSWAVILEGTDVPPEGEDVTVTASFVPQAAPDADLDSVADSTDNCPSIYNPAQTDSDGNGVGDACQAVGGIAELPRLDGGQAEVTGKAPEAPGRSGTNVGLLAGIAVAVTVSTLGGLGGAAWYVRRRRARLPRG